MAAPLALMAEEILALRDCRASSQGQIGADSRNTETKYAKCFASKTD